MRRFLYDTAVFLYAVGSAHPYRQPCAQLVKLAGEAILNGEASTELIQELTHVRWRRTGNRTDAAGLGRRVMTLCRLHDLTESDVRVGLRLFDEQARLSMRDAIHAATALNRDIDAIISPDRAFDDVPGLERLDPAEAADRLLT